ncbi:hypothetical protein CYANOKiyG1_30080 [Okeania sp. KiyG1]|nr:hypothetical protein CYANOKiyG1_30080 [Okeania sp. KiyG1]
MGEALDPFFGKLAYLDQERFLFVVQETPLFALSVIRSYSNRLRKIKDSI